MENQERYWSIIHKGDHYELYIDGRLHCSADTWSEAFEEYQEYISGFDGR